MYRIFVFQKRFARRCANIAAILAVFLLFKPERRCVGAAVPVPIAELFPCKISWIPKT